MPRKASRNAQGGGTIRQRPDGRWEARYTVGRDPGTGKQIQRSIYGATQKEVRQRLQQITMDIDEGTYTAPSRLTVEEWLNTWLNDYLLDVKPRTIQKYSSTVRNRLVPNLGKIKLRDLSARQIQHMYTASFTMDVYGHCTEEMQQQSASRMEGFIKAVSGCKGSNYEKKNKKSPNLLAIPRKLRLLCMVGV